MLKPMKDQGCPTAGDDAHNFFCRYWPGTFYRWCHLRLVRITDDESRVDDNEGRVDDNEDVNDMFEIDGQPHGHLPPDPRAFTTGTT